MRDLPPRAGAKICGIRDPIHARLAVDHGAALVGMIFAPTRRQVTRDMGRAISNAVHEQSATVRTIGVFVDADPTAVHQTAIDADLDLVQLHGDEPPDDLALVGRPAIKAFRPHPDETADHLKQRIETYLAAPVPPVAILIDGYHPGAHGGTGTRADWQMAAAIARWSPIPVLLAGGLTPDNVAEAIATVGPAMVDTSSGVERDGIKDVDLIEVFLARAHDALTTHQR